MRKFQSFDSIKNYLKTEIVPYEDKKYDILRNVITSKGKQRITFKKLSFVSVVSLVLVVSVAFSFGSDFSDLIKSMNGVVKGILSNNKGEVVYQLGIRTDSESFEQRQAQREYRDKVKNDFMDLSKSLESKLPDDKVALFIPVKGLESFIYSEILNLKEYFYTIKDIRNSLPKDSPFPIYIPEEYTFEKSFAFYNFEPFYLPALKEMTYDEYLEQLFEEAKASGEDYYYKEYNRLNSIDEFHIWYRSTTENGFKGNDSLSIRFSKGASVSVIDSKKDREVKTIEHNGREYLVYDDAIYTTYLYIDDQLWNVEIVSNLDKSEIFKIIDGIEALN
jgi:hypothetical protein